MPKHLLDRQVASSDSALTFDLTDDYDLYELHVSNANPATDGVVLKWQANAAGGSGFNETIQSSSARVYNNEGGTDTRAEYYAAGDQANGTGEQFLTSGVGNESDECASGILRLFDPLGTVFQKHFMSDFNCYNDSDYIVHVMVGGYINTTSAIDELEIKFSAGNIDSGIFTLYGIA
jgi:hypothetical protein